MKKSFVVVTALLVTLAFAGSVFAFGCGNWEYKLEVPKCKDQVLCSGKASGFIPSCVGCGGINWDAKWKTLSLCPDSKLLKKK